LFGASLPFTTVQALTGAELAAASIWKLAGVAEDRVSLGIGALGMPGSAAYAGLVDILRPEAGDVVFVSAAAGAVGGLVGQIAKKVFGCRVIGSAGGPDKCRLAVEKYGFDACIDYKTCSNAEELIAALKVRGILLQPGHHTYVGASFLTLPAVVLWCCGVLIIGPRTRRHQLLL
jgi:NADPH-dependent curcumin reductase CurA